MGMTPALAAIVTFHHPAALAALVLAAIPYLLAARARQYGRRAGWASILLQTLAVPLAVLALAGPAIPLGQQAGKPYLLLTDVSASTGGQGEKPLPWPADLPREEARFAASVGQGRETIDRSQTNLAPALRFALSRRENLAGVVLRTDGRFLDADWPAAAESLAASKLSVTIVPMDAPPADAAIADLQAVRTARGGVEIRLSVASNARQVRQLTVRREKPAPAILLEKTLDLSPDAPLTLRLADEPPAGGALYRAELSHDDSLPENDSATAYVLPRQQITALVADPADPWPAKYAAAPARNIRTIAPSAATANAYGWMDYSAVMLVGATGHLLAPSQRRALAEYVRAGGGLVLIGAGPGGATTDLCDPLNEVAALVPDPLQRRSLAVTIILDASGSMAEFVSPQGGQRKFDLAARAVLELQRYLGPRDSLRVIAFSDSAQQLYDSREGAIDFAALSRTLEAVRPGGPTKIWPALQLAAASPGNGSRDRLLLVASDLRTEPFDLAAAEKLLRENRFSLSVVCAEPPEALGQTPPLESLTAAMSGRLLKRQKLTELAAVLADFVQRARGGPIRRGRFTAKLPAFLGADFAALPPLDAMLLCRPAENANVLATADGLPLWGHRPVGLGQSETLAIPLSVTYNRAWQDSDRFGLLVDTAVSRVRAAADDPRFSGRAEFAAGRLSVAIDARDAGGPLNGLRLALRWTDDAGLAGTAAMQQVAPGKYMGDVPVGESPLVAEVRDEGSGKTVWRQAVGRRAGREYESIGADWDSLRKLATLTGGRIVDARDLPDLQRQWAAANHKDFWPWLLAAALMLVLLEWALARLVRRD